MKRRREEGGPLRVASDCSGWCSEVLAAKDASSDEVLQVFASDTSKAVRI